MSRKDSLSTARGEGGLTVSMRALNGEHVVSVITTDDNHDLLLIS